MRRTIAILFFTAVCATIGTSAQSLNERYNAKHPVVMVCDWDKPPYEYLNNQGEPAGSNIDAMRAVMKELGLPVKFVMKEWSIALKSFERGDADIIIANARRYRKAPYHVSENIINYNRVRAVSLSDSTEMITFKQLEREGAVFKPGDYSAYYFMDNGDSLNIASMEFQTPKVALMGIINGDYKYYIWGEEPLKWKIKELNLEGLSLNDVGIPISEVHVIGRDAQLVERIDDQYSRLKQRGEIAVIQDRWFHPERIQQEKDFSWVYIIIGSLLLTAILYSFSRLARKHVKVASRASTELNEMMLQALHMGNFNVMEYDIANDRFTNRYGHILPKNGMTLSEFTSRIHSDQQQEFSQKMRSMMDGRERRFELDKRWNAGTTDNPEWLNFKGHAICELDSSGKPLHIINAIHDITEEMEEDKAAYDLIQKYQVLSNMPLVAMSFYDSDGRLIALNDQMRELCGMNDDIESQHFWEALTLFDIPLFRGAYSKDSRDDMFFCQHMEYTDFGLDKYIEANLQPLFNADGEVANYLCVASDITATCLLHKELHQLTEEINTIQDNIDLQYDRMQYMLTNSKRHLMRTDIQKEQIAFYRTPDKPEYVHSFSGFLRIIAKEEREALMEILYDKTTTTTQEFIIHLIKPSEGQPGEIFHITFSPIFSERGEFIGHKGISTDITTISQRRRELVEETRRAQDSVRMKSAFMASMTHELRTPLNAIVGFTSVLQALGESPERSEYLRIIRNSSDMLQRLINDIIEASSITDGAFTIEPSEIDFAKEFDDVCTTLAQRVQDPAVEFQKENPYESFVTTLDMGRVQQVLTNFVTNAVKFTTSGHIRVGYRSERDGLLIFCEDTGRGIPKEKQPSVFERFVKLDEFVQGTGMGLAISKSIVERCGGQIGVQSEGEGCGSTFWAWFPCPSPQ